MNIHFSGIVHHPVADRVAEKIQEDSESEYVTSAEKEASEQRSIWRIEDTAKLEVKLLLRKINTPMTRLARTAASLLQMAYGPLHTSLLINDEILLEWNTTSLVIPERYGGVNQDYPIITSALQRETGISMMQYNPEEEIDLLFRATMNKVEMLNALIRVISRYNGQYFYNTMTRNCQTFVIDALKAMGCDDLPTFQGNLKGYFDDLKAGSCQPRFDTHQELDLYITANVIDAPQERQLSSQEKEYLLSQYFLYHINGLTEAENPNKWVCPVEDCQMGNLERHIDEEKMIMHRFLKINPPN